MMCKMDATGKLMFGSLFAGIGGFDLGFERAGMECKWQIEIDDYANRVLAKHWPDVRRWDDVRTFPPGPGDEWRVDVICGGDPCQRNSVASSGGSRSQALGGEFIRIVAALRPRVVVRENPYRHLPDAPWPWFRFRNELERLGYACLPFRLRACCLGADHQRDRVFVLAEDAHANGFGLEGWHGEAEPEIKPASAEALLGPASWLDVCAVAGHRSRAGIPGYVDRVRGLGNAVVPQVAEWIGRRIVESGR